jgi:thiamine biosynthesis lipoprotein
LAGCKHQEIYQQQLLTFGTLLDVTIATDNPQQAEEAFKTLQADFEKMHHQWHAWQTSPLTHFNKLLSSGQAFPVDASLAPLIKKAVNLSRQSHYLFNPAVGKLIALWGFHQDDPGREKSPSRTEINKLVTSNPSLDDIVIKDGIAHCNNSTVQVDFGGFAKGYGIGLAADHLLEMGLSDFIINAGGDLLAYGKHPQRPWQIGIRDPNGGEAIASIEPGNGEAIFTSGDYQRFYLQEGKKRHHIIDPRTGYPAQGTRAVTVIHKDPGTADAAATALLIAGPHKWIQIAADMELEHVLLMDENSKLHATEAMTARIHFNRSLTVSPILIPKVP